MNKTELIAAIAVKGEMSKKDAEKALLATLEAIEDALVQGEKVQLVGFGTFEVKDRPARAGHNPLTGAPLQIEASKAPTFKVGKALKDAVNAKA